MIINVGFFVNQFSERGTEIAVFNCDLGKLIDTQITEKYLFFDEEFFDVVENPYGNNVCEKIITKL